MEVVPGQRAVGLKNVALSEPGLVELTPGSRYLPQAYAAEAIAHCISWLVIASLEFRAKPIAVTTQEMLFDGWARPGDQLRLEADINNLRDDSALCSGRALIGERVLAEMKNGICAFVPMEALEDEVLVKARYRFLLGQEPEEGAAWEAQGLQGRWPLLAGQLWPYPYVDRVLAWEPGKRLVAAKAVTRSDSMLDAHFPKRPVLPGTVMAEALGQAGLCLLERGLEGSAAPSIRAQLRRVKKARFRRFLHPGDLLIMEAVVRRWEDDEAELNLSGSVDGQEAVRCQGLYVLEEVSWPEVLMEARETLWQSRFEGGEV